jgi:aspartyl-tRNA synthetase
VIGSEKAAPASALTGEIAEAHVGQRVEKRGLAKKRRADISSFFLQLRDRHNSASIAKNDSWLSLIH